MLCGKKIQGIVLGVVIAVAAAGLFSHLHATVVLNASQEIVEQFVAAGIYNVNEPLLLHLGCGEQRFHGYINIDFPPLQHPVQALPAADAFGDITCLWCRAGSVDQVRSHHFFEHFERQIALAMLCAWHHWLKVGGSVIIETPDFLRSAHSMLNTDISYEQKQALLRHIFGSHEARWAVHCDGWYDEKFNHVLSYLGFVINEQQKTSYRMLENITVTATKIAQLSRVELQQRAHALLRESMVDHYASSENMLWRVWCREFDQAFAVMTGSPLP